nr:hypothetical protein [Streptomyces pini]
MLRYYGVDLLDWYRGGLSSRRLAVLIRHLPRDSAVNLADHGEAAQWGAAEHLLAAAVDHLAAANWMTAALHRDEDDEPPEYPEPVPRPGQRPEEPERPEPEEQGPEEGELGDTPGTEPERAPASGPSARELARFFG